MISVGLHLHFLARNIRYFKTHIKVAGDHHESSEFLLQLASEDLSESVHWSQFVLVCPLRILD